MMLAIPVEALLIHRLQHNVFGRIRTGEKGIQLSHSQQIQFTDRFFQRGFTRRECIENWSFRRPSFLAQMKKTQSLPELFSLCDRKKGGIRVAILYSKMSLDSFFILPYVMETFKECRHISVRYFGFEHFFPFFHGKVDREFPLFFVLNSEGFTSNPWGPRVENSATEPMDDETLSQFAIKKYPVELDESLVAYFLKYLA